MKTSTILLGVLLSCSASAETIQLNVTQAVEVCRWNGNSGTCGEVATKAGKIEIDLSSSGTWKDVVEAEGIPFKSKLEISKAQSGSYQVYAWVMRHDTGENRVDLETEVGAIQSLNTLTLKGSAVAVNANLTVRPVFKFSP